MQLERDTMTHRCCFWRCKLFLLQRSRIRTDYEGKKMDPKRRYLLSYVCFTHLTTFTLQNLEERPIGLLLSHVFGQELHHPFADICERTSKDSGRMRKQSLCSLGWARHSLERAVGAIIVGWTQRSSSLGLDLLTCLEPLNLNHFHNNYLPKPDASATISKWAIFENVFRRCWNHRTPIQRWMITSLWLRENTNK